MISIKEALPQVFKRPLATIAAGTANFIAGTLIDIPRRDVFPIAYAKGRSFRLYEEKGKHRAFSGYGLLLRVSSTEPRDRYNFLFEPCERAAITIRCVDADEPLTSVFDTMSETRFGWLLAHDSGKYAAVTLGDLMALYASGILSTDLRLGEIATEMVFSLPGRTALETVVREMLERRVRRVFLQGTKSFVCDRDLMMYIFSPERLRRIRDYPSKMLEPRLAEVTPEQAFRAGAGELVSEAVPRFENSYGSPCILTTMGVVTPWDMLIKPWKAGRLEFAEEEVSRSRVDRS